jgi:hypothetical protein
MVVMSRIYFPGPRSRFYELNFLGTLGVELTNATCSHVVVSPGGVSKAVFVLGARGGAINFVDVWGTEITKIAPIGNPRRRRRHTKTVASGPSGGVGEQINTKRPSFARVAAAGISFDVAAESLRS